MAKKGKSANKSASKGMSADDHRKMAETLSARASLHHAKARVLEAKNPPKRPKGMIGY